MIWLGLHSVLLVAGSVWWGIASEFGMSVFWPAIATATSLLVMFAWFFYAGGRPAARIANLFTSFRLLAAVLTLIAIASGVTVLSGLYWGVLVLAVLGEITDNLDGRLARKYGPTWFGARLDMETDAAFMLALSFAVHYWTGVGWWVLLVGGARYVFALPYSVLPEPSFPRWFSMYARTACALAAILLVAALVPLGVTVAIVFSATALALIIVSFGLEGVMRIRAIAASPASFAALSGAQRRGLLKSLLTYYGLPFRLVQMRSLYSRFMRPGSLVFDIGAHVGNRVQAFRGLGARVVAVEPLPECAAMLRRHYEYGSDVVVVEAACGAAEGSGSLRVSSENPTLSTLSGHWIDSITRHHPDAGVTWDHELKVSTVTLDRLIEEHGEPDFVKIDVEGFEPDVLAGLSVPVKALSVEYLPASTESALRSIAAINRLGSYAFALSRVETMRLTEDRWMDSDELIARLKAMPPGGRSGDIYAVRDDR